MKIKEFIVLIACITYGVWGYPSNYFEMKSFRGGRIAGGIEAVEGQFPYQAAIYLFTNNKTNFCSGSIISETFIVSAAHCFVDMVSGIVIAGIIDLQDETPPYDFDIEIENIISHKDYDPLEFYNDIALINVSDYPFDFSDSKITKIPLGSMTLDELVGQQARIAGWGKTKDDTDIISNILYYLDAEILSKDSCISVYGSKISYSHLCLSGDGGKSTCKGDSGGGLTFKSDDDTRALIGIVSFGAEGGCAEGYPTVMTFITPYLEWIFNNINYSEK